MSAHGWAGGRGAVILGERQALMAHPATEVLALASLAPSSSPWGSPATGSKYRSLPGIDEKKSGCRNFNPHQLDKNSATQNAPIGQLQHNTSADYTYALRGDRSLRRDILRPEKNEI